VIQPELSNEKRREVGKRIMSMGLEREAGRIVFDHELKMHQTKWREQITAYVEDLMERVDKLEGHEE